MLDCRHVSQLLSESYHRKLSLREWIAVRAHLLYCGACTQFHRQLRWLRIMTRRFLGELEQTLDQQGPGLSDEARGRIAQVLRRTQP